MSSKEEILSDLRKALRHSGHVGDARTEREVARYTVAGEFPPGSAEVVERFVEAVSGHGASVFRVKNEGEVPEAIGRALEGTSSVVFPAGVAPSWIKVAIRDKAVHLDSPDEPLSHHTLDGVDAVVTASACAIAQTGTIILDGSPDQGRRALTLIPDVHVVVVDSGSIFSTVPEAFQTLEGTQTRPLTWVTGPSATSDIELQRVEGVHGPRTLRVIVVGP